MKRQRLELLLALSLRQRDDCGCLRARTELDDVYAPQVHQSTSQNGGDQHNGTVRHMEASSQLQPKHVAPELRRCVKEACEAVERILVSNDDELEQNFLDRRTPCTTDEGAGGERGQRNGDQRETVVVDSFDDALAHFDGEARPDFE